MKNKFLNFSIIITVLVTTIILACSKQDQDSESKQEQLNPSIDFNSLCSVEDNILVFNTVDNYDAFIQGLDKTNVEEYSSIESRLGFSSMRSTYLKNDTYGNLPVDDDLFMTLLNPESRIKIAGKMYEIDFENNQVELIENDGLKSAVKTTFSFEEDVLYPSERNLKTDYCPGFKNYNKHDTKWGTLETVLHYMKFGIYYRLKAEINKNFNNNSKISISLSNKVTWENKKESGSLIAGSQMTGKDKNIVFSFYSGSRRLKKWNAQDVQFGWEDYLNDGSNNNQLIDKDGSCH